MIRRFFERIASYFTDTDWLYERRKQEVLSRRETQHVELRNRKEVHFIEDEMLQRLERKKGDGHA